MENVIPSAASLEIFTLPKKPPQPKPIKVSKTITKRPVGHQKKDLFRRPAKETAQSVKDVATPAVQP